MIRRNLSLSFPPDPCYRNKEIDNVVAGGLVDVNADGLVEVFNQVDDQLLRVDDGDDAGVRVGRVFVVVRPAAAGLKVSPN